MSAFRRTVNPPCHPVRPTPLRSAIALPSFADRPPGALERVPKRLRKSLPMEITCLTKHKPHPTRPASILRLRAGRTVPFARTASRSMRSGFRPSVGARPRLTRTARLAMGSTSAPTAVSSSASRSAPCSSSKVPLNKWLLAAAGWRACAAPPRHAHGRFVPRSFGAQSCDQRHSNHIGSQPLWPETHQIGDVGNHVLIVPGRIIP